eukprot:Rmarinus@m.28664
MRWWLPLGKYKLQVPLKHPNNLQTMRCLVQWTVGDKVTYSKKCDPYEQGGKPLCEAEARQLHASIPEWYLDDDLSRLRRSYEFASYVEASQFFRKMMNLAINDGHPPESLCLTNKATVDIVLHTPRLKGLSYADFMYAFKSSCQ